MLVVEPSTLRYEDEAAADSSHHDYLAERVSMLENRLLMLAEKLEKGLDLLLRQSELTHYEHLMLETLVGALDVAGVLEQKRLYGEWREACARDDKDEHLERRNAGWPERILVELDHSARAGCESQVREGCALIEKGRRTRGLRLLESAASAEAAGSQILKFYIGMQYFSVRQMVLARDYLESAAEAAPGDAKAALLLGIACGALGDAENACQWLTRVRNKVKSSFAASSSLGLLHAAGGEWERALDEFKRAQAARPAAVEISCAVVVACYRLGRLRLALRYAKKAVEADLQYPLAHFLKGLILLKLGEEVEARKALSEARGLGMKVETKKTSAPAALNAHEKLLNVSFFGSAGHPPNHQLLAGDKRLSALLLADALEFATAR